jgi:ubiquinone/menaquinone biosynthesis C-methylase UbiE
MKEYDATVVKDHWSKKDLSASDKNFYCFPPIRSRSSKLIFNEDDARRADWCEYWTVEKYLKDKIPFENCLSICCGFGSVERTLSKLNVAKHIIGTDIAAGAIKEAETRAKAESLTNIRYYVADLNKEALPRNEYDLIWANGALHHIKELDVVIPKFHDALKPGGLFVANEYIGANYQQIGLRHQEIVNAVKHLLPKQLCRKNILLKAGNFYFLTRALRAFQRKISSLYKSDNAAYEQIWEPFSIEHFLHIDPSEGVNSEKIIPVLRRHFEDMEVRYYDGSVLMYALDEEYYDNYDPNNPHHNTLLELLFHIEDALIAIGELSRDNAHIICRKH